MAVVVGDGTSGCVKCKAGFRCRVAWGSAGGVGGGLLVDSGRCYRYGEDDEASCDS